MNSLSIVIPVFNAALTLEKLYEQLIEAVEGLTEEFEVILVDDSSLDASWEIIVGIQKGDSRVRGIRLSRNFGQHNALLCGIRTARFETVVTMDDDLQHPVSEISKLINKLEEGHDVVYGTSATRQFGFSRNLATRLTKQTLKGMMGSEAAKNVSAFRAFKTQLVDAFGHYDSPFVSIDVLLTWATSNFSAVEVEHKPRELGKSNYTLRKLASHAIDLTTGFSALPLRLSSMMGLLFTGFGFLVLAWVVGRYLITGDSVPGFPFLASIISIFSGAQLLTLGVFGEYLARIHFRTMKKPAYNVLMTTDKMAAGSALPYSKDIDNMSR